MQVWTYGGEVWLQPAAGCQDCAKRWRRHDWIDDASTGAPLFINDLLDIQRAFVAKLGSGIARRVDTLLNVVSDHSFQAHPDCPVHGVSPSSASFAAAQALPGNCPIAGLRGKSLGVMGGQLIGLVDSHLGQVRRIDDFRTEEPVSGASAQLRPTAGPGTNEHGYGRSSNTNTDRLVALIEALERRAGMRPGNDVEIVLGSKASLGARAVDPEDFILPTSIEARPHYQVYSEETEYEWVWGWSARRADAVLIPKQMVYYGDQNPVGGRFAYEISNGCAAGSSLTEATMFGILEVIERDAFLTSWHSGREVKQISETVLDEWSRGVVSRFAAEGVQTRVLDIGCGLPGTTVAVEMLCKNTCYLPVVAYAAASNPDPTVAARGALQEVAAMLRRVDSEERARRQAAGNAMMADPNLIQTMHDHATQGDSDSAERLLRFNISDSEQRDLVAVTSRPTVGLDSTLRGYIDAVLDQGLDVLVCDQSYSPAREKGLRCVKVLVPGLHSMTFGHGNARLAPGRLERFASREYWRLTPHPFP